MVALRPSYAAIFALSLILNQVSCAPQNQLNTPREASKSCFSEENGIDMCAYLTNEEMNKRINKLQTTYPDLVEVNNIGESVNGEKLTYLKITKNSSNTRTLLKPMFK